jgi:hypothetical protein
VYLISLKLFALFCPQSLENQELLEFTMIATKGEQPVNKPGSPARPASAP